MEFVEGLVDEAFVAEIEGEGGRVGAEISGEGGVVVEEAETVAGQFGEGRFEMLHGGQIFGLKFTVEFHGIGEAWVAEDDGDVGNIWAAGDGVGGAGGEFAGGVCGDEDAVRHHAEILIAVGSAQNGAVIAGADETAGKEEGVELFARVETFGVELIDEDAALGVGDDFTADEARAIGGEHAFAADEVVPVDPFPRPGLKIFPHPISVGNIHREDTTGTQRGADGGEHGEVFGLAIEVTEGVAQNGDAVEGGVGGGKRAGVALEEIDGEACGAGAAARELDEVVRAVEAGEVAEAAAGEFETVAALTAAQVEHAGAGLEAGGGEEEVDVGGGVGGVFHDVAVSLDVGGVEERAPPVGGEMAFEVGNGAEGAGFF